MKLDDEQKRKDRATQPMEHGRLRLAISPFGKRVSRQGREKRDSEEVWLHNFVTLGGVVHGMRKLWRPFSPFLNIGAITPLGAAPASFAQ